MKYRLGKNRRRAILHVKDGTELVVFPERKEKEAELVCNLLNLEEILDQRIQEAEEEMIKSEDPDPSISGFNEGVYHALTEIKFLFSEKK